MRDILHRTLNILKGRGKVITLRECVEDQVSTTDVRKNFIYITYPVRHEEPQNHPQVHIQKSFDSIHRIEKFTFRVKGFFYATRQRELLKVAFRHTLRIHLHWKSDHYTPKKTAELGLGN